MTWNSSNGAVATISNAGATNGLATSVGAGTTVITAVSGTVTNSVSVTLTVATVTLKTITITPSNATISIGATQQFTAMGTFSDSSPKDLTTQVTWKSSNKRIAEIRKAFHSNPMA